MITFINHLKPTIARMALLASISCMTPSVVAQVPGSMVMPSDSYGWSKTTTSPKHTATGGIGGADDTQAVDLNLNTPAQDTDNGKAVYSVADGWIERNISGWSGTSYGQLLVKHLNPDGSSYYCGYLHMTNVTAAKATQGAFLRAGSFLGNISNVSPDVISPHLHVACYVWNGTKLVSQSIQNSLVQVNSRPSFSLNGNVRINGVAVNSTSNYPVSRSAFFQLDASIWNSGTESKNANVRVVMTRDRNGADFVGLVGTTGQCTSIVSGGTSNQTFTKNGFASPAGNYWLQIYYDDCSSPYAAQKGVTGAPISIALY